MLLLLKQNVVSQFDISVMTYYLIPLMTFDLSL